jgi:hypothetical protein
MGKLPYRPSWIRFRWQKKKCLAEPYRQLPNPKGKCQVKSQPSQLIPSIAQQDHAQNCDGVLLQQV